MFEGKSIKSKTRINQVTIQTIICNLSLINVQICYDIHTRASLMPVSLVFGLSKTRNAARLAVYDATMIIANPAHTIPNTRAEKLRGVPIHIAEDQ